MPGLDLKKTFHDLRGLRHRLGFKKFLRRLTYSRHEEIILVKDLKDVVHFSIEERLKVYNIKKEHLPRLGLFRQQCGIAGENPSEALEMYLNHDCKGFMAEDQGEIIGYIWWGDNKTNYDFDFKGYGFYVKEIGLAPSDTYGFDFFIDPRYRGGGRALEILTKYFLALKALGYEKNFGYVLKDNKEAYWIYKITGHKDFKRLVARRFFVFFLFRNFEFIFDRNGKEWLFRAPSGAHLKKKQGQGSILNENKNQ